MENYPISSAGEVVSDNQFSKVLDPGNSPQNTLESESGDWEIVASDGKTFKVHSSVLAEQISYFRELFSHQSTTEYKTKRVVLPADMEVSGQALETFLQYIYYKESNKWVLEDFNVAYSLIRLAKHYNVPELVEAVCQRIRLLLQNGEIADHLNKDFWDLYYYVLLLEDTHPYKDDLLETLDYAFKATNNQEHQKLVAAEDDDEEIRVLLVTVSKLTVVDVVPCKRRRGEEENLPEMKRQRDRGDGYIAGVHTI